MEDWTVEHLLRTTEDAVTFAVIEGLPVMYVTEDTVRTDPETVKTLYTTAIRAGARAAVFCDTVGHATPRGAYNLITFAIENVVKPSGEKIRVDWHGHNDRGLSVANSHRGVCGGRRSGACCGTRSGRARWKYADGIDDGEFAADWGSLIAICRG